MSSQEPGANDREDPGDESLHPTEIGDAAFATNTIAANEAEIGTVIGPYHLLQQIGQGGMGEVWLAEQKQPVRRRVAIKLIKAGMDTREVVARFESERQALALMDHPNIAKVFDAGSTPQGRPYFVMEYVTGIPITDYCDKHKLPPRDRLDLFVHVCEGVQHAHQKAIIHRDLKPSNILVGEIDGKPLPRIIDFGVAKATSQRLTAQTMFTRVGAIVGTPGYMSPEQADPAGMDVDTRTDVYSLGVILYELLVGVLPLDFHKLAFDEIMRRLREEDAPRPSTKVRTLGERSAITAQNRGVDYPTLARQLRGDLDAIALKALDKERSRRYATPLELAADIGRYLHNEPVTARPDSTVYRARKYIRRHRIGVGIAAAAMLLVVSFSIVQAFQVQRITHERDRANHERDRADRIAKFMIDMFKVTDPSEAKGNTITAREVLDKGSNEITSALSKDPDLQVKMLNTMGHVYINLGLFSRAQRLLEQAVATGRRTGGSANQATLDSIGNLAFIRMREGRYADAEKLLRETVDGQKRVLGATHVSTLASMRYLATNLELQGKYAEAEKLQHEVLDTDRRELGPEHWETLLSMNVLANILDDEGRLAEAEKLYRDTAGIQRRTLGPKHQDTMTTMSNLGGVLDDEGKFQEAEAIKRETLALRTQVLGADHPDTLVVKLNLATTLNNLGRRAEAEKLYRETLAVQRKVVGPDSPEALYTLTSLANNLHSQGRNAEAEKLQREALNGRRRLLGPDHPDTLKTTADFAGLLSSEGKYAEAETLYLDLVKKAGASGRSRIAEAWYDFACGAAISGHPDDAFRYLRQAFDHGYRGAEHMTKDDDLKSLRNDPRFAALIQELRLRDGKVR